MVDYINKINCGLLLVMDCLGMANNGLRMVNHGFIMANWWGMIVSDGSVLFNDGLVNNGCINGEWWW